MSNETWKVTPDELYRLAYSLVRKEHNRYFLSEYTPYDSEDLVQDMVLHVCERMDEGFIPNKPSVAYEWMKTFLIRYWRDTFSKHPQYLDETKSIRPAQVLSIEELEESLLDNEETFDIEDLYVTNEFERVGLEADTIDLSIDKKGEVPFLFQLNRMLELEGFMPGREIDIIADGLATQDWGSGTSQFIRDFRRHNVHDKIEYRNYPDGTLLIFIGNGENVRGYKLVNRGE